MYCVFFHYLKPANDGECGRRFPFKCSCIGDNRKRLCVFVTVVDLACSAVILAVVLINKNNMFNCNGILNLLCSKVSSISNDIAPIKLQIYYFQHLNSS